MATIYDVDQSELVEKSVEELKKISEISPPQWAIFVKTGAHKERPPAEKDWWYVRSASVLRLVYRIGPIGVSKLRVKYGGKKNRGVKPEKFYKSSGNIIRKVLQQLEKAGFVKKEEKGRYKGRAITAEGKSFLDKIATQLTKGTKVKKEVKKEAKEGLKEEPKKSKQEKTEKSPEKEVEGAIKVKKEQTAKLKEEKIPTAHELAKKNK